MNISVIIPAYNEEAYIGQCLASLGKQTVQPVEIIVVDNNCTDRTVEIASKFPLVRVVREKRQGMIIARNCGFSAAKGEIIARCDADSMLPPNWIKIIQEDFSRGERDPSVPIRGVGMTKKEILNQVQDDSVVGSGLHRIDALTGPVIYYDLPLRSIYLAQTYLLMVKSMQWGKETLVGPNMVITKAIWKKVKNTVCLNDKKVHEDLDLAIHIHEAGGKILRDKRLVAQTSSRRLTHNPKSFFGEYPIRFANTLLMHQQPIPMPKSIQRISTTLNRVRQEMRGRM